MKIWILTVFVLIFWSFDLISPVTTPTDVKNSLHETIKFLFESLWLFLLIKVFLNHFLMTFIVSELWHFSSCFSRHDV